ncbi:unnamed protein product [Linum trigynum]
MGPTKSLIEWLKPDCFFPNKKKKKRSNPPPPSSRSPAAVNGRRRKPRPSPGTPLTLEEHLSSTSPLPMGLARPASTGRSWKLPDPSSGPTGCGVRKPSPKRIHPSSSSSAARGGRRRKGKGKENNSFTLETLVKLDRESKDDYFSGSSSRGNFGDGSGVGLPTGSQSCRREGKKNGKSVRFTLPGDGDVLVFYSPRAPTDRPFHSL